MTHQLIELLLYSLILSLYINALHIMFQKEMFLNWHYRSVYNWLESKFIAVKLKDLDWQIELDQKDKADLILYTAKGFRKHEIYEEGKLKATIYWDKIYKNEFSPEYMPNAKWRNSEGLLFIAKPIYACASCMPSLHSLPLLLILPLWKVAIIAVISVTISTLINDKIFE